MTLDKIYATAYCSHDMKLQLTIAEVQEVLDALRDSRRALRFSALVTSGPSSPRSRKIDAWIKQSISLSDNIQAQTVRAICR